VFPCLKMAFLALALPGRHHVYLIGQPLSDYNPLVTGQAAQVVSQFETSSAAVPWSASDSEPT
jgi:hypothetical protein